MCLFLLFGGAGGARAVMEAVPVVDSPFALYCAETMRTMAIFFRVRSADWMPFERLSRGDKIVHPHLGFIEVVSVKQTADVLVVRRPGELGLLTLEQQRGLRFADVSTQKRYPAIRERINRAFSRAERIPAYFALSVIHNRRGTALGNRYEEMLKAMDVETGLSALNGLIGRAMLGDAAAADVVEKLAAKIYAETGENLVRTAILDLYAKGIVGEGQWPAIGVPAPRLTNLAFVGGNVLHVDPDIDLQVRFDLWKATPIGSDDVPLSNMAIAPYYGPNHPAHPGPSQQMNEFKRTDNLKHIDGLIRGAAEGMREFVGSVTRRSPGSTVLVPIPGSSERSSSQKRRIAGVIGRITNTAVDASLLRRDDNSPIRRQTTLRSLHDLLNNVSYPGFADIHGDVEGKTIILVDDVGSSGATVAQVRRALMEAGAHAVYAINLLDASLRE